MEIDNALREQKLPNPDSFIKENFLSWRFNDEMISQHSEGKLAFYFVFETELGISLFEQEKEYYLSINGAIVKKEKDRADYFEVHDRDEAIKICNELNNKVVSLCAGFDVTHFNKLVFS